MAAAIWGSLPKTKLRGFSLLPRALGRGFFPPHSGLFVLPQPPARSAGSRPAVLTAEVSARLDLWSLCASASGSPSWQQRGTQAAVSDPALWPQGGALPDNTQLYVNILALSGGVGCTHSPRLL